LPEPLWPTKPKTSPRCISSCTSRKTCLPEYATERRAESRAGVGIVEDIDISIHFWMRANP
jgi:hypothetical protein